MVVKHLWNLGIVFVLVSYPVFLVIGFNQGTLNILTGLLFTALSVSTIGILYWLPKLTEYLERRLFDEE